jgi:hypothetical protein
MAMLSLPSSVLFMSCSDKSGTDSQEAREVEDYFMYCDDTLLIEYCDDSESSITNENVNDTDCDLVITSEDCDDNDANVVNINVDADCDLIITSEDCDDNNVGLGNRELDLDYDGLLNNQYIDTDGDRLDDFLIAAYLSGYTGYGFGTVCLFSGATLPYLIESNEINLEVSDFKIVG